jgi:F0F1-type ATP synthase epsilon subunit
MPEGFRLVIRTPHQLVLDERVRSVRVPTETGQVGLRPNGEPVLLVIEPGLVLLRAATALGFAATAGGLLESDRERCVLYTPVAVVGSSEDEVLAALERLLAVPDREVVARQQLGELERRIIQEARGGPRGPGRRGGGHERPAG